MEFHITRTSASSWDDEKPCAEAYRRQYVRYDIRNTDDPTKLRYGTEWWYGEGKNHRVENNKIIRDFISTGWFVQIFNLEDLLFLKNKYGNLIILDWGESDYKTIEIYDGYRE